MKELTILFKMSFFRGTVLLVNLLLLLSSCNDDFLQERDFQEIYQTEDTIFISSDAEPFDLDLSLFLSDGASWRILQHPLWIDIEPKQGVNKEGEIVTFTFTVQKDYFNYGLGLFEAPLVFESPGRGIESKTILYMNMGNPVMRATPSNLILKDKQSGQINIENEGYGVLEWEVISQPEWLEMSEISGILGPDQSSELSYSVTPGDMEQGDYQGEIVIANNAGRNFRIPLKWIIQNIGRRNIFYEEEMAGTLFLKEENTLLVLIRNPNRLMYFSEENKRLEYKDLDREPTCMTSMEDGKIAIGFTNAEVSIMDAMTGTLEMTYAVQNIPKSIAFSGKDHLYYVAEIDRTDILHHYNVINGEVTTSKRGINGAGNLNYIPSRELIVFNKPRHSPTGMYFYKVTNGEVNKFNQYHMDTGGFWLSDGGDRFYTQDRKVYQVPEFIEESVNSTGDGGIIFVDPPPTIGQFGVGYNEFVASVGDHKKGNEFFVASNEYSTGRGQIQVYDRDKFVLKQSVEFEVPRPDGFHNGRSWSIRTVGIYPDASGTKVWLLHKYPGYISFEAEMWSVMLMDLE